MNFFGGLAFVWVVALSGYVFWCLEAIAKRLDDSRAGWAWFPGLNLILVPRLAGRSSWTALLLLV